MRALGSPVVVIAGPGDNNIISFAAVAGGAGDLMEAALHIV